MANVFCGMLGGALKKFVIKTEGGFRKDGKKLF